MSVTKEELDSFYHFAAETIQRTEDDISWDELFIQWQSARERSDVNAAIREGLADVEAGRYRPADEVMNEIRKDFGFAE